ncbi:MAG: tetratricopeptide repeat protein [Deltaproteobacteria bacterium]|nr:tetratricopeptide repeat protein [Deltaproteobacteria bacterium]
MRPAILVLSALLATTPAIAQTEPFQEVFEEGIAAFQARDYETALQRFQRSYILSRRPELLFNIGLTLERVGRREDAIATLRQFVSLQPNSPQRADAERRIATMQSTSLPVVTPPVVAPPVVAPPVVAPPVVAPPVVAPPVVVTAPRIAPAPVASRPVWPWVALGGGAAAGIAGAVILATTSDPGADDSVITEGQYESALESNDTRRIVGAVLLGLGGAAAVAGVVGLVQGRPSSERASLGVYGWPLAGGGIIGVSGHAF